MRTSALFDAKNSAFFEIDVVSARTRELSKCGYFAYKGEGVNFLRFCADVFYGLPLILYNVRIILYCYKTCNRAQKSRNDHMNILCQWHSTNSATNNCNLLEGVIHALTNMIQNKKLLLFLVWKLL